MSKPVSLSDAIKKCQDGRTLIEDEKENLIINKDLSCCERFRIFLNRWWVFALLILAVCQVVQTIISLLTYYSA